MVYLDGGNAFSVFEDDANVDTFTTITKTFGDVQRAVKRSFGDEAGVQVDDTDIANWINDAQMSIVSRNGVLKARASVTATVGQSTYTFPDANIYKIDSIHYNGARLANVPFAQAEETIINPSLNDLTGAPQFWYEWGGQIKFWPATNEAKEIVIYYTARPATVDSQSTTKLGLPDKYYTSIVSYVLAKAYELDEDWQASQIKSQQFNEDINIMGEEERTAQNMTYETITIVDDLY